MRGKARVRYLVNITSKAVYKIGPTVDVRVETPYGPFAFLFIEL